jgi:hypothetical protein
MEEFFFLLSNIVREKLTFLVIKYVGYTLFGNTHNAFLKGGDTCLLVSSLFAISIDQTAQSQRFSSYLEL